MRVAPAQSSCGRSAAPRLCYSPPLCSEDRHCCAYLVSYPTAVGCVPQVAIPIVLSDRESLIKSAVTSLASKVVYQNAALLAPIAVDSVLRVRL